MDLELFREIGRFFDFLRVKSQHPPQAVDRRLTEPFDNGIIRSRCFGARFWFLTVRLSAGSKKHEQSYDQQSHKVLL